MKRLVLAATWLMLFASFAITLAQTRDFTKMTPDQIEELKQERHAFYKAESAGKNEAIRQSILDASTKMNPNQQDYDMRYYGINLSLNFGSGTIDGYVDYQIRPVVSGFNSVDLNLVDQLYVSSVTVDGSPAAYSHSSDILSITTPTTYNAGQEFDMRVYYEGTPLFTGQQGMAFDYVNGYEMCWTNCEPFGTRHWLPCKDEPDDKPDSIDLYLEYPSNYDLASNGKIISDTDIGSGRKLIHYKHMYPIATYLIAITCADFNVDVRTWNYGEVSMPFYSFALPNAGGSYYAYRNYTSSVLTNLSNAWNTYPWATEKAGNANYGWGGAMEHQTCAFYSPTFYDEWVLVHEQGHQWWGDMITCATFHDVWLNEGWASYSEPIYYEQTQGQAAYFNYLQSQKYLGSGTIYVEDLVNDDIFDNNLVYDKGSWVVHMLRGVLGDAAFFQFVDDYYNSAYKYGAATTSDFTQVLSASVGEDMSWFVDQWIYGNGHPDYDVSWRCSADNAKSGYILDLYIEQVQTTGDFYKMPIKTIFVTSAGDLDTVIWNTAQGQAYQLHFNNEVTDIVIDPNEWILRTVDYVPFTMHISTTTLPEGHFNVPYSEQLQAVGGVAPYHWVLVGGDLPIGLSFDAATATLSGTPTWKATYYFTMQVTDSDSPPKSDTRSYALKIGDQVGLAGDADGNGMVNISDAVYLISYIFGGGPAPDPLSAGDADCNGIVNISDAVFVVAYIFGGGSTPNCP